MHFTPFFWACYLWDTVYDPVSLMKKGGCLKNAYHESSTNISSWRRFWDCWKRNTPAGYLNSIGICQEYFFESGELHIALVTGSVVLPLRHRVAKEAASIDQLFPGRLIMGVASEDRDKDFTALGISKQESGPLFKENFEILNRLLKEDQPTIHSQPGWSMVQIWG